MRVSAVLSPGDVQSDVIRIHAVGYVHQFVTHSQLLAGYSEPLPDRSRRSEPCQDRIDEPNVTASGSPGTDLPVTKHRRQSQHTEPCHVNSR